MRNFIVEEEFILFYKKSIKSQQTEEDWCIQACHWGLIGHGYSFKSSNKFWKSWCFRVLFGGETKPILKNDKADSKAD